MFNVILSLIYFQDFFFSFEIGYLCVYKILEQHFYSFWSLSFNRNLDKIPLVTERKMCYQSKVYTFAGD